MKYATELEAKDAIQVKLRAAFAAISEAQAIADENDVGFSFDIGYGMGGRYIPESKQDADDRDYGGWYSSTRSCS